MSLPIRCAKWRAQIRQAPHVGSPIDPLGLDTEFIPDDWVVSATLTAELSAPARVVLQLRSCGTIFAGGQVVPRGHELWLTREGETAPTFRGPIVTTIDGVYATLVAYDRSWWMTNRERRRPSSGDVSTVAVDLYEQADEQDTIGLAVDSRVHGRVHRCQQLLIGTDLEEAQARWAVTGDLLQIGPQPFWRETRPYTEDDWDDIPSLGVLGEFMHPTVLGSGGDFRTAAAGIWARSAEVTPDASDTRARWVLQSAPYTGRGSADGRGPRIEIITGTGTTTEGATVANSLRYGTRMVWDSLRVGAWVPSAITGRYGARVGSLDAPRDMEITGRTVTVGAGGREESVTIDLATLTDTSEQTSGVS